LTTGLYNCVSVLQNAHDAKQSREIWEIWEMYGYHMGMVTCKSLVTT